MVEAARIARGDFFGFCIVVRLPTEIMSAIQSVCHATSCNNCMLMLHQIRVVMPHMTNQICKGAYTHATGLKPVWDRVIKSSCNCTAL